MNKYYLFLSIVFILGLVLRFYRLGDIPVGLHRDEAFLGFNAYSILNTGRDMSGNFLPLHLQSFLYSPAGYSYFSIPFVYLFDLSAFSVRFASAFFGSLSVLICFFLSLEIFSLVKNKYSIALISSFLLAISPWNINLSRTATENNIVVFFISAATLLFFVGLRKKNFLFFILSFIFYALTLFIYQAPRAFLPLFIPLLFICCFKSYSLRKNFKLYLLFLIVIVIPVVFIISSKDLSLRLRTLSIFSNTQTSAVIQEYIAGDGVNSINPAFARVFHNKIEAYSAQILQNYFKHFSYDFLFSDNGFPDRYRVPSMGLLYILELPLLLLGIYKIAKSKNKKQIFLLFWVGLAPVGSALTFDDIPNLQRTLIVFPALSIISAVGLLGFISYIKSYGKLSNLVSAICGFVALYSLFFYVHQYWIHSPRYRPWYRQDGYMELVGKVNSFLPQYKSVVITNRESAPSVFFLFYSKYEPLLFQQETIKSDKNKSDSTNFGKFTFSDHECPLEQKDIRKILPEKGTMYVNSGNCKSPTDANILDIIKRGDDSKVFEILSFNE